MVSPEWQALIDEKRVLRESLIPDHWKVPDHIIKQVSPESTISAFKLLKDCDMLSNEELDITEKYDATSLIGLLASQKVSSVAVTTAFCKRAAIGQQLVSDVPPDKSRMLIFCVPERAQLLDDYLERHGRPMGPFHGLPISVKDMFMVKDQYATLGYVSYLKKPEAVENSVVIDMLLDGGAVLYCKTTVPQGLFVVEGYNNVFGQTMNPHNLSLGPGGSSSGEGALVGFRGSILGLGSDIGGSIRAPSLCNGIFGFKPSSDRLPYSRQQEFFPKGWPSIVCSIGPHARSARDLTLFCKSIIQARPWCLDSTAYALPWRDVVKKPKLRVGVWSDDPSFPVHPPVARILATAVARMRDAGHDIVPLEGAPSLLDAAITAVRSFALDIDQTPLKHLRTSGEELHPSVKEMMDQTFHPDHTPDLSDIWQINAAKDNIREEWAQVWQGHDLDVLVCPGSRSTAVPHGRYGGPAWTMIWNLLDFPAAVVPYLKADKALDHQIMDGYDSEAVNCAPGSIQIVGWRFQDEEVLMATEIISEAPYAHDLTASPEAKL